MKISMSVAALGLLSLAASAQTYVYDQPMAAGGGTLRPSQLWIDPTGQNDSDNDAIAWEDFELTQSAYITRVRWWGEAAPSLGFSISFFYQDPGTIAVQPDIFAPGSGPIREEFITSFSQSSVGGGLYRFEADLAAPLYVPANSRRFISILGQVPLSYVSWRWAASSTGPNGTFWWQRGLHMFFHLGESRAVSLATSATSNLGVPFCFGDGLSGPCPCGNNSVYGRGCANSTGTGAVLSATGSASVAADDLLLSTSALPPHQNGLLFMSAATGPGATFGDGRRCVGAPASRFWVQNSGANGTFVHGPGLAAFALRFPGSNHLLAGRAMAFQAWYRDATGPCNTKTNLSNALLIPLVP